MISQRFVYASIPNFPLGMPFVDVQLSFQGQKVTTPALVDSGSALNILPFDIGIEAGLKWDEQSFPINVSGALKGAEAYAVLLQFQLAPFPPLDMAFAWINRRSSDIRLLLGQVNFFQEFDVHFYGHQQAFEIVRP